MYSPEPFRITIVRDSPSDIDSRSNVASGLDSTVTWSVRMDDTKWKMSHPPSVRFPLRGGEFDFHVAKPPSTATLIACDPICVERQATKPTHTYCCVTHPSRHSQLVTIPYWHVATLSPKQRLPRSIIHCFVVLLLLYA
jgi:hypothetical protein